MYNKPFYYQPPSYQGSRNSNYPYPPTQQQQYNPYSGQNQPMQFQTPFEQFSKPKQPADWYQYMEQNSANHQQPNAKPPSNFLAQFQDENGQMNFDKMLSTVGQMANTYHQVQPIFKQFGNLIKTFK